MPRILTTLLPWLFSSLAYAVTTTSSAPQPNFSAAQLNNLVVELDAQAYAAASPLPRDLIGMSIEFCYITSYLGDLHAPNTFSFNLLQNIQNITGSPPRLRLGGDTGDNAAYCPACPATLNNTFAAGNAEAVNVSFNANLFTVLNENVPSNQEYTFGLNLGVGLIDVPLAEFTAAQKYMNLSRLTAYELGNEPDFYAVRSGKRLPGTWDVTAYVKQSVSFLLQLLASTKNSDAVKFMYGSMAEGTAVKFSTQSLVQFGVQKAVNGIKIFSEHLYFGDACTAADAALVPITVLLNHINTVSTVSAFIPAVATARSTGDSFWIGETNSIACHGVAGVSDALGAALWMVDYSLLSATIGVEGLYFHNGLTFAYSLWEPLATNTTATHANALYYGLLLFSDLVATLPSTAQIFQITALSTFETAVYAISPSSYHPVEKLVILNLDFFNATIPRTTKTFDVSTVLGKNVTVSRLTGSASNATTGLTWAGQSVDGQGNLSGTKILETVSNGSVSVSSSEAVLVQLV